MKSYTDECIESLLREIAIFRNDCLYPSLFEKTANSLLDKISKVLYNPDKRNDSSPFCGMPEKGVMTEPLELNVYRVDDIDHDYRSLNEYSAVKTAYKMALRVYMDEYLGDECWRYIAVYPCGMATVIVKRCRAKRSQPVQINKGGGVSMTQLAVFDYDSLAPKTREFLLMKEKSIKFRMATSIIDTGRDLIEAKEKCDFGQFIPWVNHAFGMSKERAAEYMRVAKEFSGIDSDLLDQFGKSALVMLSSRSMPVEVRDKAFDLAESGEKVSVDVVKKLRQEIDQLKEYKEISEERRSELENLELCVSNLKSEITVLKVREPEKVVEVVEKEVLVTVPPADYEEVKFQNSNFRLQAETALQSADEIRMRLDKEKAESEKLKIRLSYEKALSQIETGVTLIHQYINAERFDSLDIPFALQTKISDVRCFLSQLQSPGCDSGIDTNKSSRDKLLKAGFVLIRSDEESLTIKQYSGNGSWVRHSSYENRCSFRDALKSLSADDMVILA